MEANLHPIIQQIVDHLPKLTPKGRILGNFVVGHPRQAVFMTIKELAAACKVSEATVVRFVRQLGYGTYKSFLQLLRDLVYTDMIIQGCAGIPEIKGSKSDRLKSVIAKEIANMHKIYRTIDRETLSNFVEDLSEAPLVFVVGSRRSYTFAYYLGWSLSRVRKDVHILNGSDSTTLDRLNNARPNVLVLIITICRYPNELIHLARVVRRLNQTLFIIADSPICPLLSYAHKALVIPYQSTPYIGYNAAIFSVIGNLVLEVITRRSEAVCLHQEQLERMYLENDIFFNLRVADDARTVLD